MLLGQKTGKPKRKRKNARARYDKEFPVLPVRVPQNVKKQLAREAKRKGLMVSEYVRQLLQGLVVRERVVEVVAEKPVVETVTKTISDPSKDKRIEELEQEVDKLKKELSLGRREVAKTSREHSTQLEDFTRLRESLDSLSKRYEKLRTVNANSQLDLREKQSKIEELETSVSSISALYDALLKESKRAEHQIEDLGSQATELSEENERLNRRLEWALTELTSNDSQNERIAQKIANAHGIQMKVVMTNWEEMPRD